MSKQIKQNFSSGDLERYRTALEYARKSKQSFQIVSTGLSRKIIMPNGYKLNYFGRKGAQNLVEGAFLVMMVKREIDAYIEKNGIPAQVEPTQGDGGAQGPNRCGDYPLMTCSVFRRGG